MKKVFSTLKNKSKGLIKWFLSLSVYIKVLGISVLMIVMFAAFFIFNFENHIKKSLQTTLAKRVFFMADTISSVLENHLKNEDKNFLLEEFKRIFKKSKDLCFIIIRDKDNRDIAQFFLNNIDRQETVKEKFQKLKSNINKYLQDGKRKIFFYEFLGHPIIITMAPIKDGEAGNFILGVSGKDIEEKIAIIKDSFLWVMIVCFIFGIGLAVILTYFMTRPIKHLVYSTRKIQQGDFQARAKVFFNDEIGKLAIAFNQMAQGLEKYENRVKVKENQCMSLIDQLISAQEEERKSISRELHDQMGQSLSALLLETHSLAKENQPTKEKFSKSLEELEKRIKKIIDDIKRIAWNMRPSILDDYGLKIAVERYAKEMKNQYNISIDYHYESLDASRLPGSIEVSLYRIIQEGVINAIRHSEANQISIVLIQKKDNVVLLVEDNGHGFDDLGKFHKKQNGGLGLINMRERATLIGGSFEIESSPETGSTVRVKIPIK